MRTWRTRSTLLALALALLAGSASAQDVRARVQGLVSDTSGGVLPGATVVLTNDGTGVSATKITNADGRFLFDFVESGNYSLAANLPGFKTAVQKAIRVQQRGDLTVDMKLEIGGIEERVEVTQAITTVQFNTATRDLTIAQEMVQELPSSTRNPLQLAMLDPTTIQRGSTIETQPYHHRTANEMDIGGGTKYRNDVLLDGTPLTAGNKLGYTPPMDAVSEYTIQQNSVDAEFGHSAGGIAIVTMKGGTNKVHGSAYYFGRDSSLNAMSDRVQQKHNDNPYWNAGGSIGMPLKKNKLFLFAVFDAIENTQSSAGNYTLPTALERQGDFSQSYNADGSLRVIYDPLTSRTVNGVQVRDPFPGNKIPANRWDPVAAQILSGLWQPNNAGDDATGFNNFKYQNEQVFHYYNFSTRLDWNINERWKANAPRQPHEDRPGPGRLHRRQRSAQAAQRHRHQAQRLERRGRHGLHAQLRRPRSTCAAPSTRPRTSATTRTWPSARRATRTCGRTAGGSPTPRTGRSSTLPTSSSRAPLARSSACRTSGTSSPRATACTRASTSTSPSTRSRAARRSASSAARRPASTTRRRSSWPARLPTSGPARARRPASRGPASCSARWTPPTRASATRSCRSPTPSSTASTSRTTAR